jgi:nucleoside-diphosphate-sugar epimerase
MILVTGATGFLGSELVKQLSLQGKPLRALKRQTSVIPEILSQNKLIEWHDADILDYFALKEAMEGVSEVYHCAAMISFKTADRKRMLKVNVEGTAILVNICLENKVRKLVHASSISAIGQSKMGGLINETDQWQFTKKESRYAISKYESELEVNRGVAEGLNAVIVNPSVIIGKNAGITGSGQLFETVKKGLKFYPSGGCGLVDVEDVVRTMIALMESNISAERYILNSENFSYRDLFTSIAKAYGLTPPKFKLYSWMLKSGFLLSSMARAITGNDYGLTRELVNSASKTTKYSNQKISEALGISFKPIRQSITEICGR